MNTTGLSKRYLRRTAALALGILFMASIGAFGISTLGQRDVSMRSVNVHALDKVLVAVAEMSVALEQIRMNPNLQRSRVEQGRVSRALRTAREGAFEMDAAFRAGRFSAEAEKIFLTMTLSLIDELRDLFLLAGIIVDPENDAKKKATAAALAADISRQLIPVLQRVIQEEIGAVDRATDRQLLLSIFATFVALSGIGVVIVLVLLPMERLIVASQEEIEASRQEALAASLAKSQFLATMSHEIRTPLNGVLGLNQVLQDSETDPERRQMLALAVSSGQSLLQIINDILDLSKIEAGKLELERGDFDAIALCQDVTDLFQMQAQEKGVALKLQLPDGVDTWWVSGFAKEVRQILLNLVSNALKFTDSGSVTVHLSEDQNPKDGGVLMRISVQDTGIGISGEALERVFEQFEQADASTTTRYGGTGLGLPIVKRLAEALEGRVSAESAVGEGSRFTLVLPVQNAISSAVEKSSAQRPEPVLAGTRVLVADDNRVNQLVAQKMLEKLGCEVKAAHDGFVAVQLEREWRPDIVLMDVRMPGMDGLEATRNIREAARDAERSAVSIIGLSANALQEHRRAGLEAGMDGYLTKPLKREALVAELQRHLSIIELNNKSETSKCV
ncbi:Autoinducer 2 sensor kinase/phosphatase LuxQ [Shimia sp. SK013]|uniref:ATP-binding protein n=1 Tax=Shimia sp. SK013 TaxID=1389006 RepID=UPI0006B56CF1|nr:ATP-binding protein [Shimia sp. SK013]KPA23685.1 Autoinducer 2 sensor kinase/phosphatase LuxQ [Shimia sp. SK013]